MAVKKEGCKKEVVWQKRGDKKIVGVAKEGWQKKGWGWRKRGGKKTVGVEKKCWQKSRGGRKSNKEWHHHLLFVSTFLPPPPFSCDPLLLAPPIFRHPFNASPILFCKYFHATSFTKSRKPKNLKCCKMSIWLQKSASIQPRTSLPKFQAGVSFTMQFHIRIPPLVDRALITSIFFGRAEVQQNIDTLV